MQDPDLALLRQLRQSARQLTDHCVLPVPQLCGVNRRLAECDAMIGHGRRVVDYFRRVQQCL